MQIISENFLLLAEPEHLHFIPLLECGHQYRKSPPSAGQVGEPARPLEICDPHR